MTQRSITKVIANEFLADFMKASGFLQKGQAWNRCNGDFVDIVVLQTAKFSSEHEATVTLDFALGVPEFRKIIFGSAPKFFSEADGLFVTRISELLQGANGEAARDEWWRIPAESVKERGQEIAESLQTHLEPYFADLHTFAGVWRFQEGVRGWQTKSPHFQINRALVCLKLGDIADAEEFLVKAKSWPEQVARVRSSM